MRWFRRARSPQQASPGATIEELARDHREATTHEQRAVALWALVARGDEARAWCEAALRSGDQARIEDAAGVLRSIGADGAVPALIEGYAALPDGAARDAVVEALPAADRAALLGSETARSASRVPEEIWFIEAPFEACAGKYRSWLGGRYSDHRGTLFELLPLLDPPVKPSWKTLLIETASPWTALIIQSFSGASSTPHLGRLLGARTLRTSYVEGEDVAFWLHDQAGHELRTLQASRQLAGWSWEAKGDPQPFEDLSHYQARRIAQRLDLDLLLDYCRAFGIARDAPGFYGPRALLHEQDWHRKRG